MSELKPCPFCNGKAALHDNRLSWYIDCECGAFISGEYAPEPDCEMPSEYWDMYRMTAIDAWNTRTPPPIEEDK
jgi:hypothetical protein